MCQSSLCFNIGAKFLFSLLFLEIHAQYKGNPKQTTAAISNS